MMSLPGLPAPQRQALRIARSAPAVSLATISAAAGVDEISVIDAAVGAGRGRCAAASTAALAASRYWGHWMLVLQDRKCPPSLRRAACHDPSVVLTEHAFTAMEAGASLSRDFSKHFQQRMHAPLRTQDQFAGHVPGTAGWAARTHPMWAPPRLHTVRYAASQDRCTKSRRLLTL